MAQKSLKTPLRNIKMAPYTMNEDKLLLNSAELLLTHVYIYKRAVSHFSSTYEAVRITPSK